MTVPAFSPVERRDDACRLGTSTSRISAELIRRGASMSTTTPK